MAEAKRKDDWERTSLIAFLLAEPNRDRKRRSSPFSPADFNPYAPKTKPVPIPADITALKMLLPSNQRPK